MPKKTIFLIFVCIIFLNGCAEIKPFEAPSQVLKHPLGTDPITIGMTKEKVESLWGVPDQINKLGFADQWGTPKEEWIYKGRYSKIPINKGYFYKSKYLYFDGNILTSFGDEPQKETTPEK